MPSLTPLTPQQEERIRAWLGKEECHLFVGSLAAERNAALRAAYDEAMQVPLVTLGNLFTRPPTESEHLARAASLAIAIEAISQRAKTPDAEFYQ